MISHEYSEWKEPEKPPFSVEDVVNTVKELMMRYHVSFDEALRALMERGLPYNQFLKVNGLDELVKGFLDSLQKMKDEIREGHRLDQTRGKVEEELRRKAAEVARLLGKMKDDRPLGKFKESVERSDIPGLFQLDWMLSRSDESPAERAREPLMDLVHLLQQAETLADLDKRHAFTGEKSPTPEEARRLAERLGALEKLEGDLQEALENGDLLSMSSEAVQEMLGEEAAQALDAKRDELRKMFQEAMRQTQQADYDEGTDLYKITPGGARKIGERALQEVFSRLFTDGMGRHHATFTGEGNVEMTPTKPYEFGDSLAHLDLPSSLLGSAIRQSGDPTAVPGKIRLDARDFQVHLTRGSAASAIVMLIDQSGSMARYGRFYNTKKLALALDALIRTEYPEDKLWFVAFSTFARQVGVGEIPSLAPKPVTVMGGGTNITVDYSQGVPSGARDWIPEHFTNLQKGLSLARVLLANADTRNKSVLLITDGAPTAYYDGPKLHLTYPPTERTYDATLREVRAATDEGVTINTFMMADEDVGYFGEREFLERMHQVNQGRLIYPAPDKLTQYVLRDFMTHKRKIIQI